MTSFDHIPVLRYDAPRLVRVMQSEFRMGRGIRVGETTVVSRRVHVIHPANPGEIKVIVNQDAGVAFYARRRKDEILHIDVFHEVAEVDHRRAAEAVKRAVHRFYGDLLLDRARGLFLPQPRELIDLMDIQTGTGGGRIGGALNYGRKLSLRRAHCNHVHIAAMLPDNCLLALFYLVLALEEEITGQGVEIRKVERLTHQEGTGKSDLSPYSSMFDSYLNESGTAGHGQDWERLPREARIEAVSCMAEEFGGRANMARLLDLLPASGAIPPDIRSDTGDLDEVLERLSAFDLVARERGQLTLTAKGREVRDILATCASEVEAGIRRLIRKMPLVPRIPRHEEGRFGRKANHERPKVSKSVRAPKEGEWCDEIAVPETVLAALSREHLERGCSRQSSSSSAGENAIAPTLAPRLTREDIRLYRKRPARPPEVCLLIDASASMVGRRIRAAKYLIRHLATACQVKVTVLTFQERDVRLQIASTRSRKVIEEGVRRIEPAGLTPLAAGITEALDFIRSKKLKDVLLVLITDGIPTMNRWTADPARDALTAAKRIAEDKVPFMCVGLQPNRDFLRKLVDTAGGKLYVVDEFDKDVLISLVRYGRKESAKGGFSPFRAE
ncbi:MAG: VWA domain-containing protein [Firmicutes bacterium]|jgi:magnesium chelatase subunit D|nr:VWA domain-containing protein [Bacillota bacterium]MDH7495579.1 VWA domain-containing protein [Bacillota bacterium]